MVFTVFSACSHPYLHRLGATVVGFVGVGGSDAGTPVTGGLVAGESGGGRYVAGESDGVIAQSTFCGQSHA